MKLLFSSAALMLGLSLPHVAQGGRVRKKGHAHGRKLNVHDEFAACAVKKDLPKIGSADNMMHETQGGLDVAYCATFSDIVATTMCGDMNLHISCSGSGDNSQVTIEFDEVLDETKKDEMFPPGHRLVVMCDDGDLVSDYASGFSRDEVGGYRFMAVGEATFSDNKAILDGMAIPWDFMMTMEIHASGKIGDGDSRRALEEHLATERGMSTLDGRELTERELFDTSLTIFDASFTAGPVTIDLFAEAGISGSVDIDLSTGTDGCIKEPFFGTCTFLDHYKAEMTASAHYEITATAGFDFTFQTSNSFNLVDIEQSNPPTLAIPGAGYTVNIPGLIYSAIKPFFDIESSYTLGLAIRAPWFVEVQLLAEAQFKTGASVTYNLGKKGFAASLKISTKSGVSNSFEKTFDEPASITTTLPELPSADNVEAELTLELFAGIKPQVVVDTLGIATAAIGVKAGVVASGSFQNPPFLPEPATGLIQLGQCDDCHRIQLELAAAMRDPFFHYKFVGAIENTVNIADVDLKYEFLLACLWNDSDLPTDTCIAQATDSPVTTSPPITTGPPVTSPPITTGPPVTGPPSTSPPVTGPPTDPPSPGMMGDPHLLSWSDEWFDYMGECDLNLFHVPNFDGDADLTVHVRTTIRYDYSFIESAAIRIGEDVLEVSSWGDFAHNGVEGALSNFWAQSNKGHGIHLPSVGGYPIVHTIKSKTSHAFDIVLPNNQNITIGSTKDLVSVKIHHANEQSFGNVEGFLGDFHGHMLARDGVTVLVDDIDALGQEWQVRDDEPRLFGTARAPQYPTKCRLPDLAAKESRRLGEGINESTASAACAHLKGNAHAFKACVYDVTATNDITLANGELY